MEKQDLFPTHPHLFKTKSLVNLVVFQRYHFLIKSVRVKDF